ncbi:MAG: hypothetical protein Q9217_004138 [Psora testacea]
MSIYPEYFLDNEIAEFFAKTSATRDACDPKAKALTQGTVVLVLDSMDVIFSLPMVLLHRDFGPCNLMVEETLCHLIGVIDWAEAEICPFSQNLHSLEALTGALHLRNGWRRHEGYDALQHAFWYAFQDEVRDLSTETMKTIKTARVMGLLLSCGFTNRLANKAPATAILDDEVGRYNMLSLDGFLVNPATRFDDLD